MLSSPSLVYILPVILPDLGGNDGASLLLKQVDGRSDLRGSVESSATSAKCAAKLEQRNDFM